jgi:hypothetical protein
MTLFPHQAQWTNGVPITGVQAFAGVEDRCRSDVVDGAPVVTGWSRSVTPGQAPTRRWGEEPRSGSCTPGSCGMSCAKAPAATQLCSSRLSTKRPGCT